MNRNNKIFIVSAIAAGAAALFYMLTTKKKKKAGAEQVPVRRTRHRINTFAKAKQHLPG